jgi:metallophosphoesterase (TIGR00282 family)
MSDKIIKALVLGDIVGQPGMRVIFTSLKQLIKETDADFVVINGENAADGFGITVQNAEQLFTLGVDVITTGNHLWQKPEILPFLEANHRLLRPLNYPYNPPGVGWTTVEKRGKKLAVLNLQGRLRLMNIDCPFQKAGTVLKKIAEQTKAIIVDFHAEDPMEKESMLFELCGKVSAVVGTHTHVQTADERIAGGHTAYITDIGMTGPLDSVIGGDPQIAIERSLTQLPLKNEVIEHTARISGVVIEIDQDSGRALSIERILFPKTP